MTLKKALEEMQGGLMLIMDAVKEGNTRGRTPSPDCRRLLDRALKAERLK